MVIRGIVTGIEADESWSDTEYRRVKIKLPWPSGELILRLKKYDARALELDRGVTVTIQIDKKGGK